MARSKNDLPPTADHEHGAGSAVETYTPDQGRSLTDAVLAALDAYTDVDLSGSEFVLNDVINPDALDALIRHGAGANTTIAFTVNDVRVTIREDEQVHVVVGER